MKFPAGRLAALAILVCLCGSAQNRKVDTRNQHERVIAVVPLIGRGTMEDPKRPMFVPVPGSVAASSRTDVIAFHFVPSDDGNFAIVELIARDRAGFAAVLNSADSRVKAFTSGSASRASIETAIRQYRKDFSLDTFGEVVVP